MNIKANYFKSTFLGLSDMNEVRGITRNNGVRYARVSKVSADSFDFFSMSLGEIYENATTHDLVAPGLSSFPDFTNIYLLLQH